MTKGKHDRRGGKSGLEELFTTSNVPKRGGGGLEKGGVMNPGNMVR